MAESVTQSAIAAPDLARSPTADINRSTFVGVIVRMRLKLWRASYRNNKAGIVVAVIGLVYALPTLIMAGIALVGGAYSKPAVTLEFLPLAGVVITGLWTLAPMVGFGVSDPLAVRKFALLPLTGRQLRAGLFAASFCSIPAMLTVVLSALAAISGTIISWSLPPGMPQRILGTVVSWVGAASGCALALMIPRVAGAFTSRRQVSRRRREVTQIASSAALVLAPLVLVAFMTNSEFSISTLAPYLKVVEYTPFGAPLALVSGVAAGNWILAAVSLVWLVACLWRLSVVWASALDIGLTHAAVSPEAIGKVRSGAFLYRFLPKSAIGVVAARSLRYWRRDNRYFFSALTVPVMGVIFIAIGVNSTALSVYVYLGLWMLLWGDSMVIANDFATDGPSGWVHLVTSIDARADLLGRQLAGGIVSLPTVVFGMILLAVLRSDPGFFSIILPVGLGVLLISLALAGMTSVVLPYPAKSPGAHLMSSKGFSANALFSTFLLMCGAPLVMAPTIGLMVYGIVSDSLWKYVGSLSSLAVGVVAFLLVNRFSAGYLQSHRQAIFAKTRNWLE